MDTPINSRTFVTHNGPEKGLGNRLAPDQEKQAKRLIIDGTPDPLKVDCALWTREAVMSLIKQESNYSAWHETSR